MKIKLVRPGPRIHTNLDGKLRQVQVGETFFAKGVPKKWAPFVEVIDEPAEGAVPVVNTDNETLDKKYERVVGRKPAWNASEETKLAHIAEAEGTD